jgi:hypothetical protein
MSDVEDLHRLAELRERGVITQDEFDKKKQQILKEADNKQNHVTSFKRKGLWWKIPLLIIAAIFFKSYVSNNDNESITSVNNNPGTGPSQIRVSPYERMRTMMPTEQSAVIKVVEAARQQYAAGANEMAKGASRPSRAQALCSVLPNRVVNSWIGRVDTLSTNGDGKGVIVLEFGNKMSVKTWNNSLSDVSDKTLIDPSSSLFIVATQLKKAQLVRFSGQFFRSQADCIEESSMSLLGSINEPEFIFRFQSITPIDN